MIIKAEKIVYGTIVELDSNYFTLNVEGSLTADSGTLKIARFQDWPCAARWTKYKVGQQLFLFLTTWNGELVSMSGGNEGENPIIDNTVYIHGFSIPILPPPPPPGVTLREGLIYFETEHFEIYGGDYYGIQWNLNSFIETVSFIRNCFDFTYGKYRARTNWQIKCDSSELEQMCKESKLVNWVNSEANRKDER
ncbi:hypothetical protein GCM10027429_16040 [Marivirga atlantica]|uniref:Uncharacterized protein n=1 Tax=Marivirga atlantica TaxID=1548457 RepID=A0A937AAD2_9BACT|nr:hypothetical protein [Marivirga atlantica]MBL0765221.1 hypothetical protein [Marivirga atlantica]